MKGTKPKPVRLRLLEGNRRKIKVPDESNYTMVEGNLPEPPIPLGEYALQEWQRMGEALANLQMLSLTDLTVLAIYCMHTGRLIEAQKQVIACKEPLVLENKQGNVVENPVYRAIRNESAMAQKAAVEFGLTPSART